MENIITRDKDTETYELGKYAKSFGLSLAITNLISALLVVLKEIQEDSVLAWMKAATGHHWVTHGVLNLILFLFFGWLLARPNEGKGVTINPGFLVLSIVTSLIANVLIIAGFYAF
mgnify:CR=1 FL=1